MSSRIMIVGAGVAGLAASRALRRAGADVVLLDEGRGPARPDRAEVVWADGMAALESVGAAATVRDQGRELEVEEFRSRRGGLLYRVPVGELARRHGAAVPVVVRRGLLLAALAGEPVRRGRASAVEQDGNAVTVRLESGETERGSVLLGADGVHSTVRRAVFPGSEARPAEIEWLHGTARFSHPALGSGRFVLTFGRGDLFGVRDPGGGELFWFAAVPRGAGAGGKAALQARFRSHHAPIAELIEATPESAVCRVELDLLAPLPSWSEGRVALLGDAACTTSPNLGRGSVKALVDAVTAAGLLSGSGDPAGALRAYGAQRRAAAVTLDGQARGLDRVAAWTSPFKCALRDAVSRFLLARSAPRKIAEELAAMGASRDQKS
jgi:2-polyprenyl-6-methoxyphenol hydroxylase-like FAD-dependent oxidoreductase